ncbi:hypothetical protein JMJ77_0006233, partial [Colletotrichum scovillei]
AHLFVRSAIRLTRLEFQRLNLAFPVVEQSPSGFSVTAYAASPQLAFAPEQGPECTLQRRRRSRCGRGPASDLDVS